MRWVKGFLYIVYLAIFLALGVAAQVVVRMGETIAGPDQGLATVWQGISNPRALFPGQDRIVLLLVGQDYNRNRQGIAYTKMSRADTIMLLGIDLAKRKVSALSVPRDTFVRAPDGRSGKINGTFSRGGIELLQDTLQELLGVSVDHHIIIKPSAIRTIVDTVGGVHVESIDEMRYHDNWGGLHIELPKGRLFLNGDQAEGFVRFREVNRYRMNSRGYMVPIRNVKGSKEEGDLRRTARQQQMVSALLASANTPSNWLQLDAIIDVGFRQIETDMTRTQFLALATLFRGSDTSGMESATIPGDGDMSSDAYYYRPDEERARTMAEWLVLGNEDAARRLVSIRLYNGTSTQGLARKYAEVLEQQGFETSVIGNADPTLETRIEYGTASVRRVAEWAKTALGAGLIEKVSIEEDADLQSAIKVIVGQDLEQRAGLL